MSIAKTFSAHLIGLNACLVEIEVDISNGLNAFNVVGLGDRAVEEAKDRIAAAIKNTGYTSPKQKNQKVVISLAPADIRKEGTAFDLAMAVAYLKAARDIEFDETDTLFLGELSLGGEVRPVSGILPVLIQAKSFGFKRAFIPKGNSDEAGLARGIRTYGVSSLRELIMHIGDKEKIPCIRKTPLVSKVKGKILYDMSDVRGNETAKRGLEIAAAGGHNVIMCGPPGTGKTMLAQSFHTILPPLSYEHSVEVTSIHSAAHILEKGLICDPPFRAPHHTASYPAVIGGGVFPKPGEITLAHRGVLFMDEFPEFDRSVIEALRQPLEERQVTISRARGIVSFPANCILIASMNPCPCGKGQSSSGCTCNNRDVQNYSRRVSGPIMDRIDIWIQVNKVDYDKMSQVSVKNESSETIRKRVTKAREKQEKRFMGSNKKTSMNSLMDASDINKYVVMTDEARIILKESASKLEISGRAFHRIIKVAQTISDLDCKDVIEKSHILEAIQYRRHPLG